MAAYIAHEPLENGRYHLWADTPEEALTAAILAGATWSDARPDRSPRHYEVDASAMAAALVAGALIRDKFDAFADAMRAIGRTDMLAGIDDWLVSEGHAPRRYRA